jgi:hypothetical protein
MKTEFLSPVLVVSAALVASLGLSADAINSNRRQQVVTPAALVVSRLDDGRHSDIPRLYTTSSHLMTIPSLLILRGGVDSEYDVSDDEEEEFYDDEDQDQDASRLPPPRQSKRGPPPRQGPPSKGNYDHRLARPPPSRNRRPPPSKSKKTADWAKSLASNSLKLSGQVAWKTVSMPGKVGYHLIRPKHVDEVEIGGLWRLDQQITERGDRIVASVATIELDPRKHVVIVRPQEGPPLIQPYKFSKGKLGSYKMEFVAKTFMVGSQTRMYGYKGTWQRKLADPKVLKLVGKIYQLRKNRLSKGFTLGNPVGTFVARRRVQLADDDFDEEEEYDQFEEEDDEVYEMEEEEEMYDDEEF